MTVVIAILVLTTIILAISVGILRDKVTILSNEIKRIQTLIR